ncbi:MAG: putative Lysyl endopeptidase, partial [Verrucomicrobiaceae bacterium]|nr:putative Lysyl endopeptidase [Verrucomicrobiaceae bacterium]
TFAGTLADGAAFTVSTVVGTAPNAGYAQPHALLYVALYASKGYLRGDFQFNNTLGGNNDFAASLQWSKPALTTEKYYPAGFTTTLAASGQRYTPPTPGVRALPGLDGTGRFTLGLDGAGFSLVNHDVFWLVTNQINTALFNDPRMTLVLAPATGLVSGTVTSAAPKSPALPARTVILQGSATLQGFFLNTTTKTSGSIQRF